MENKYVSWFKELNKKDISLVGGKGANLGEMYNANIPIPPGFVVTTKAYKKFIEYNRLQDKIYDALYELDVENNQKLQEASQKVQKMIIDSTIPDDIREEIRESYDNLNVNHDLFKNAGKALDIIKAGRELPFVAVRSSATAEDIDEASFAGQQATFLNVKGFSNLILAVQRCWASLFTARAIYYRIKNNFPHEKVFIAVVIQRMVKSDKSGVIFSVNPMTNNEKEIVIEAGFGLGEAIVSGSINPDQYIVNKENLEIQKIKVNKQDWMYILDINLNKTIRRNIPEEKKEEQVLTEFEIRKLGELTKNIENHYGKPQDIEFAIEGTKVYIVQSRPITTLKKPYEDKQEIKGESILEGIGASPGVGSGTVKIVQDVDGLGKIEKGDVLVAKMTNPDYVSAMEKASAIVTDEGGATCFSKDTKVLTNKGFLRMDEVRRMHNEGDILFIFSYDYKKRKPKWKKIINTYKRKSKAIRIATSQTNRMNHNILDVTENHKIYTFKGRNLIKKELNKILEDKESVCLVDRLPKVHNELNKPKLAYLVGALASDGCIKITPHHTGNLRRGSVVFTQKKTEDKLEFINTVKSYFNGVFECEFNLEKEKIGGGCINGRQISGGATDFICTKLYPALELIKIMNNLVKWTLILDEISCLNLLAGLIDGDGCFYENRLHIYVNKEHVAQSAILACLKLGIVPQVTVNRDIHHIQILEKMDDILMFTKRVNGKIREKILGTKLYAAKQILKDVIDEINWGGKIKPYVKNNLLIDHRKLIKRILPMARGKLKEELIYLLKSNLRMHRIKKIKDLGLIDVYNIEVEAKDGLDKNYIIFTSKYTPLLVSNCHAAIVSREMGIPAVVGTEKATQVLKEGEEVTVNGGTGKIYSGKVEIEHKKEEYETIEGNIETITEIKVLLDMPKLAEKAAQTGADGVGLLRAEFMILEEKEHPWYMIQQGRKDELVEKLKNDLVSIASAFKRKPVWYRTLDAPTDEFRNMDGGENEPEEDNPMLGWRSIRRDLDQPGLLKAQFEAIKKAHDEGYTNIGVMLPLVTSVKQIQKAKEYLREFDLEPQENIEFGVMIETPAAVQIIKEICEESVDFVSFGTNDLTQFTLAVDRNNAKVQKLYDEKHPAVIRQIEKVIKVCKEYNVETSICGQAGSDEEMAEILVKLGIDSISANIDAVRKIRYVVSKVEKKLLLDVARDKIKTN
jgi:pyruvate,water dikinase